jgi:hypothetical protein
LILFIEQVYDDTTCTVKDDINMEAAPNATDGQRRYVDAINKTGSIEKAAKLLDISISTIDRALRAMRNTNDKKAAKVADKSTEKSPTNSHRVHALIPDMQVRYDQPTNHIEWVGKYLAEMQPDVIVNIGDFADMPSLSSYDKGKKSFEGRRYALDIKAAKDAMEILTSPIRAVRGYKPEMHLTLGNHENRITRAIECDPILEDTMGVSNLKYESFGWTVHDFLTPITIDGVSYAHYFYNPMNGRAYSGAVDTMIRNIGFSFSMGHQQGLRLSNKPLNNGRTVRGLVAGSCYLHNEAYIGPQGNDHWQGIIIKHEVQDGNYCLMEVSLDYLCSKYEQISLIKFKKEIGL